MADGSKLRAFAIYISFAKLMVMCDLDMLLADNDKIIVAGTWNAKRNMALSSHQC